ncbi:MAG: Ig-like domain-containing protein, partial [Clostridia bacterium]|nr:Ig-like domain-containing protein [Clostridia bacterium]
MQSKIKHRLATVFVAVLAVICLLFGVGCAGDSEKFSLSSTALTLTVGETKTITVQKDKETLSATEVEWESSDSAIVKVVLGEVIAVKEGTAVVSAKIGEETLTCTVTVKPIVPEIALNIQMLSLQVGESALLTATVQNSTQEALWKTSNDCVTVSDGYVTAVKAGQVTVTAYITTENGNVTAVCAVEVTDKIVAKLLLNGEAAENEISLNVGESVAYSFVLEKNGQIVENPQFEITAGAGLQIEGGAIIGKTSGEYALKVTSADCELNFTVFVYDVVTGEVFYQDQAVETMNVGLNEAIVLRAEIKVNGAVQTPDSLIWDFKSSVLTEDDSVFTFSDVESCEIVCKAVLNGREYTLKTFTLIAEATADDVNGLIEALSQEDDKTALSYRERAEKLRNWYALLTVTEKAKVNEYQYLLAAYGLTDKEEVLFYTGSPAGEQQVTAGKYYAENGEYYFDESAVAGRMGYVSDKVYDGALGDAATNGAYRISTFTDENESQNNTAAIYRVRFDKVKTVDLGNFDELYFYAYAGTNLSGYYPRVALVKNYVGPCNDSNRVGGSGGIKELTVGQWVKVSFDISEISTLMNFGLEFGGRYEADSLNGTFKTLQRSWIYLSDIYLGRKAPTLTLSETDVVLKEGDTKQLTASAEWYGATETTVEWTSLNESVVTVKDGVLTAVADGIATVKACLKNTDTEAVVTVVVTGANVTSTGLNALVQEMLTTMDKTSDSYKLNVVKAKAYYAEVSDKEKVNYTEYLLAIS